MEALKGLEPAGVWKFFEEISGIPRGSWNEKAVSDYCVAFAKERGLEVYQDKAWNVIIIKEATAGYEEKEPMILQGHLDMVCEKTPDCSLDLKKDGLKLKVDGDYVYAEGTTLGGDDGIAIAYALAILDDDSIPHPRLECIFTTCEEVGMEGASALDVSPIHGHTVLNLDSELEGTFLTGCAGGCRVVCTLPVQMEVARGLSVRLRIHGLQGGHSGVEIDKGRGNASVLMAELLSALEGQVNYQLVRIDGGQKDNAIPRECTAELLFPMSREEGSCTESLKHAKELIAKREAEWKQEYVLRDPGLKISVEETGEWTGLVFSEEARKKTLALLLGLPNGIQSMSADIEGLVETSLNLGILETVDEGVRLSFALRSSLKTAKDHLVQKLKVMMEYAGGTAVTTGDYPAWEYRRDSRLREDCVRIYKELFGREPKVEAIHAGLECGILASKLPDMDCVSMGPDILDIHTTEERMSISSVERMWRFILRVLER